MDVLSWKNKLESAGIFITLNLICYLVILGGYSIIAIACYVLIAFILVINVHGLIYKSPEDPDGDYLYVSKQALEKVFIEGYKCFQIIDKKLHKGMEDTLEIIIMLLAVAWLSELFGGAGLLWLLIVLTFTLTPQYYSNKSLVDQKLIEVSSIIKEGKRTIYDLIPKHKSS